MPYHVRLFESDSCRGKRTGGELREVPKGSPLLKDQGPERLEHKREYVKLQREVEGVSKKRKSCVETVSQCGAQDYDHCVEQIRANMKEPDCRTSYVGEERRAWKL